jgi:HSP20 family protein
MIGKGKGAQLEVARIQSEINRLFETLLRLRDGGAEAGTWTPAVDMMESPSHLVIEAEVPGVDPASVEVVAEGGNVVLTGERRLSSGRAGAEVLHDEREYGRFLVAVPLATAVNTHEARATLTQGLLRIEMPKVPNRRGQARRITVQTA